MSDDTHVGAALQRIRAESEALAAELETLDPADWNRLSSCPPWSVRVLIGHTIRSGDSYLRAIERGLCGDLDTDESTADRTRRQEAIAAQDPPKIVADLQVITARFEREIEILRPDRLGLLGRHPFGLRPVHWFVDQRLAEVAFHRLDLHASLGRQVDLDQKTAALLLPMLLEINLPVMMGPEYPRGRGTFRLAVTDDPSATWTAVAQPGSLIVSRSRNERADVTLEGDSAALALLVYGRRTVDELQQLERLKVSGDPVLAARFGEIFKGP
jgi:uncharacterized protein (TIGR03083 family)